VGPATVHGMRALALWAVLFAAYAATLGVNAVGERDYGGDEPRYLLVAESIAGDGDIDLTDEFATREYADFYPGALPRQGQVMVGRSVEPQGIGFALLIAPAYALGGANAVEAFLAALAALGFVLAAAVGRRMVPEPWASGAALVVGLSPPALAHATAVYPDAAAGTVLAGAALCALLVR
jgi:4-amino-4-deoxy-L-arabinose transferase-like glycosyltransferase